jgi:N6-adenosine-specific RNA methylase IME4
MPRSRASALALTNLLYDYLMEIFDWMRCTASTTALRYHSLRSWGFDFMQKLN